MNPEELNIENIRELPTHDQTTAKQTHKNWVREQRRKEYLEVHAGQSEYLKKYNKEETHNEKSTP